MYRMMLNKCYFGTSMTAFELHTRTNSFIDRLILMEIWSLSENVFSYWEFVLRVNVVSFV